MTAAHTPGPWSLQIEENVGGWKGNSYHVQISAGECLIASYDCSYVEYPPSNETNEANGRLMTAAPDLLKALNDARTYIEATVLNTSSHKTAANYGGCLQRIDAAIAKATGSAA